ncbi:hypothetical protein NEAUS03_0091 [Nematocida ausubeli]|nr:hypothetical protein NEAUS03_0091 [Nematocida ausubeli]
MDYSHCRDILDEDSEDGQHPNIDSRTFQKWKREKKEGVKEELRCRLQELTANGKELSPEEEQEVQTINHLLRKKIIEKQTYTQMASASSLFEIAMVETEVPEILHLFNVICESTNTMEYIKALESAIETQPADEVEEYLLHCIKYNVEEKYFEATQRIAQCVIALEYIRVNKGCVNTRVLEAIQREGALYHSRVLEAYKEKEPESKSP